MKRYSLPDGKTYRPFGSPDVITNENITDEVVELLIEQNPSLRKVFIDHAQPEPAPAAPALPLAADDETPSTKTETPEDKQVAPPAPKAPALEDNTKAQLREIYTQLTGKVADEKLNKEALLALVKSEQDAKNLLG